MLILAFEPRAQIFIGIFILFRPTVISDGSVIQNRIFTFHCATNYKTLKTQQICQKIYYACLDDNSLTKGAE